MVAIVGEPGVGKTRLCYELTHAPHTHGWLVLESSALSYGQATPYLPVRELLTAYFQIDGRDAARTIREKVTGKLVTLDPTLGPTLPAFLTLLDVPVEDAPWQALEPSQRRQRTLQALKALLLRESQVQPVLVVCENLHWIDAETQAFLESLLESLPTARLLLLVNYRPEYQHGWGQKSTYTQLRLDPLPAASAADLLEALLGADAGLTPLKGLLIARTEGNPFFLEESVRTLLERGVLVGAPGAYRLAQALASIEVPATVQAVLAARIDRLPPEEKRLLQAAAVIGTDVPGVLLEALDEIPAAALPGALTHLQAAEFLYETRLFPDLAYTFKHALTQQVAYESLLQERRRGLHARIVAALEGLAGEGAPLRWRPSADAVAGEGLCPAPTPSRQRLAEQVDRLAHHALRGEVWDKALAYARQAGEKAMARSAHRQAVGYLEQALSALAHLPEARETREQAVDLRLALRTALFPSGDAGRILAVLHEAEVLAEALDDPHRLGQVCGFLSIHFLNVMGAYAQATAAAQRALALATASGDGLLQAMANGFLGEAYRAQGDYRRAIDCYGHTVATFEGTRGHERFGQVSLPAVRYRAHLAVSHAELGTFAEGCSLGDEGLRIAEEVAHPASLMFASRGLGLLCLQQGDLRRALPLLERAMDLCQDMDLPVYFPWMAAALGAAYTLGGRVADAMPLLTQAMDQVMTTARRGSQVLCSLPLSKTQLLAGHLEEAQTLAEQALALARTYQERGHEAYALHLLGEIAAHRDPLETAPAEAHYRQALALAEALEMRPLQAHCHRSLGTLYATAGQRQRARAALTTAIALYRAMAMTFWLPQAEAALAQAERR